MQFKIWIWIYETDYKNYYRNSWKHNKCRFFSLLLYVPLRQLHNFSFQVQVAVSKNERITT